MERAGSHGEALREATEVIFGDRPAHRMSCFRAWLRASVIESIANQLFRGLETFGRKNESGALGHNFLIRSKISEEEESESLLSTSVSNFLTHPV